MIECEMCDDEFSPQGFPNHIKHSHEISIEKYVSQFGEFRKDRSSKGERKTSNVECEICENTYSSVGMATHLKHSHGLTVDEYVENHSEFRKKKLREQKYDDVECRICNEKLASEKKLTYHLKKDHKISSKEKYAVKYIHNGNHPKCECGCGEKTSFVHNHPYFRDYVNGHNTKGKNNPMYGRHHDQRSKKEMKKKAISRGSPQTKETKPEKEFYSKFDCEKQHETKAGIVDFYFPDKQWYVEVDGEYWHPDDKTKLNNKRLRGVINDYKKDQAIDPLFRIRPHSIDSIQSINDIPKFAYDASYEWSDSDVIISSNYLNQVSDDQKLRDISGSITTFCQDVIDDFPMPSSKRNLNEVVDEIRNYDLSRTRTKTGFRNNIWSVGNSLLKSRFESFWKTSFTNSDSPVECWNDRLKLRKVIRDRIGLNERGEVFDISMKSIRRGMASMRYVVSFLKPLVAASIYDFFLETNNPTVIDPCAGFGSRLLGFKSLYPNGIYIGIEQNPETCKELESLGKELPGEFQVINDKQQSISPKSLPDPDMTFTSPPYPNTEIYSNGHDLSNWNDFLTGLSRFENLFLKVREDMITNKKKKWPLAKSQSHFGNASKEMVWKVN